MIITKQITFAQVFILYARPLRATLSYEAAPIYAAASPEPIRQAVLDAQCAPWDDGDFIHTFKNHSKLEWFEYSKYLCGVDTGRRVGIRSTWVSKAQLLDIMLGRGGVTWLGPLEHID